MGFSRLKARRKDQVRLQLQGRADLPRTTERSGRESGDECSELPRREAPQSHGRKSVVRGLLPVINLGYFGESTVIRDRVRLPRTTERPVRKRGNSRCEILFSVEGWQAGRRLLIARLPTDGIAPRQQRSASTFWSS